ncbi:MAG TPA: hypothetical protein VKA95_01575 [Nitrososphaeraceae archaeon]|nr:hypothetical protein [Nitrososphaeraceae archaeon]
MFNIVRRVLPLRVEKIPPLYNKTSTNKSANFGGDTLTISGGATC